MPSVEKRGLMRAVCGGRYKFSREFALDKWNNPKLLDELCAYNDVELFGQPENLDETHNCATDRSTHKALVGEENDKVDALMAEEIIGPDDDKDFRGSKKSSRLPGTCLILDGFLE